MHGFHLIPKDVCCAIFYWRVNRWISFVMQIMKDHFCAICYETAHNARRELYENNVIAGNNGNRARGTPTNFLTKLV